MASTEKQRLNRYQKSRRVILAAVIVLLFAALLFVRSVLDPETHEIVEIVGILLIAFGIGGRLWSTLYVGGRKASEIVQDGPYSVMRNPLYFFSTVAAVGAGAMAGSVTIALLFGLLCSIAFHVVIRREEDYLAQTFGRPYLDYVDAVPRFFPDPRLYRDQEMVSFKPARLRRTLFDGLLFFAAFPVFETIEAAQADGTLPVLLSLP